MSDAAETPAYGDALSQPYWAAAAAGRLAIQRCVRCGHHQFYPRPFCLACERGEVRWVEAAGSGNIYSLTTVHLRILEELEPPYLVALVELDEGPILLSRIVGPDGEALAAGVEIGDPVIVAWLPREGMPPLPVFRRTDRSREEPDRGAP